MNDADRPSPDERLSAWLEACDAALASGAEPPRPGEAGLAPDLRPRAERGLAGLQLLHRWLPRSRPAGDGPADGTADLPWANLGRFRLIRELGRGGFGRVYLAHDPRLGREVALKVPHPETLTAELRERFRREACAASALDHPNLVPVYEAGEVGPVCFIVSPYCPGLTLAQWLRQRRDPVPFAEAAALIATLAEAVQHAHQRGIVHRDLKPANILLQAQGLQPLGLAVPKITDFGLAKLLLGEGADEATRSRVVVGTAGYMAPEQARGRSRDVGPACDIYALGAILYELLTGRPPFQGESDLDTLRHVQADEPVAPTRLRPRTPRDLQTICLKCLHKEPPRRYASAAALADDLRRFLRGEAIRARPAGSAERLGRWLRRNPALAAAAGLAALALVGSAALALSFASYQARAADSLRQKEQETRAALEEVRRQSGLARRQAALAALDQGLTLCEQGHVRSGTLWLAHSAALADTLPAAEGAAVGHAARLNLAAWRPRLPALAGLFAHPGPVNAVAFSPDGTLVLTACGDGVGRLWDADPGRPARLELPHGGKVNCAAFRADGRTVATGGSDGAVRLWSAATGELLAELKQAGPVRAVALSPDGRLVLAGGDGGVGLCQAERGAAVAPLPGWGGLASAVVFCEGGRTAVAGCADGRVRFWDVATRALLPRALSHDGDVRAIALSPDGQVLLTGSADESARLWEVSTGRPIGEPLRHQGYLKAVAFSPDGRTVVTASGWLARAWDAATGRPLGEPLPHRQAVRAVAFRPGGRAVLTGSDDGTARLWEAAAGRDPDHALRASRGVQCVAFSPDGRLALTAGFDRLGHVWDAATGQEVRRLVGHAGTINAVAFSPDGSTAATGGDDHAVRLWDVATGRERCRPLEGPGAPVCLVAFSPGGKQLLTAAVDGWTGVWEVATGRLACEVRHPGTIGSWAAAFGPDGTTFLTGGSDGSARLWDAADGRPLRTLPHGANVLAVAFSPDGRLLLTGSSDQTARLWDAAGGGPDGEPFAHQGQVRAVAFSGDGSRLVTAGFDHTARVWDTASRRLLGPPVRHDSGIRDAALSPDGRLLVTASFDHTARVWDVATGRPVGPALAFGNWAVSVAFRRDGRAVLVGSCDGTTRLREIAPPVEGDAARLRAWAELLAGMELSEEDGPRVLDAAAWADRRRHLDEPGGAPMP